MVVTREYVDIPVAERAMRTFVTAPAADGAWPAVVFYTDIFQLTESSVRWAVRLAGHGFLVAVPEIYHRLEPPGAVFAFDDAGKARGQADAEGITTAEFDEDVAAAIAWLGDRRIGAAGHCTGGHLAFRAALSPAVRGTACWYPTGLHDGKLGADRSDALQRAGEIGGELLLIFGTRDPHTPAPARATVHTALDDAGVTYAWHEYRAEHAFGRDVGHRYDPAATDAAFAETVAFFHRTLR